MPVNHSSTCYPLFLSQLYLFPDMNFMRKSVQGYQQDLCHYLYSLQQANFYCDVAIATRDGLDLLIPAHSIVLFGSQSPILQGILEGTVGKQHFVISDFDNESACVIQSMVKSLYTGEIEFTTEMIEPLKSLYKSLLLHKFVAVCEEASKIAFTIDMNLVFNAKDANVEECMPIDNSSTTGENAQNIVEKSNDCDGLYGTSFKEVGDEESIVIPTGTGINECGEKVKNLKGKGKHKSHDPVNQQGELESHTKRKRRKSVPEVTDMSVLTDETNIQSKGKEKTENTKSKKTETAIPKSGKNGETKNAKTKKRGGDVQKQSKNGKTKKAKANTFLFCKIGGNQGTTDLKIGETPRETTYCDISASDNKEELKVNQSVKTKRKKMCKTIKLETTKSRNAGRKDIRTNSVGQAEPEFITTESVDSSSTNNSSINVTGKRVKKNRSTKFKGVTIICAHCDKPVGDCHCPIIGQKAFSKKCWKCPLRFLDQAQWYKHYKDEHGVWCVECDFHHFTGVRVAQHMYSRHKRMLDEEKYPLMKCDVKV